MLLVKDGFLVDPVSGRNGVFDILIEDGHVAEVDTCIEVKDSYEVIDAKGKYIMPGFVDLHEHFREPGYTYKETVKTGSMAAARGGFTSVFCMPNTKPVIDSKDSYDALVDIIKNDACINVFPVGAITKGQMGKELSEIEKMAESGMKAEREDGKSVMNSLLCREGMKLAKALNIPVFAHCEDTNLAARGVMNAGERAKELGLFGIMDAVEDVIVARDILLAKNTGAKLHISHVSNKESAFIIKIAKEQGIPVTAEVAPHHFTLTEDAVNGDDANFKINPPLRKADDVKALKEALASGVIDVIATDHAPHHPTEKERPFDEAPFGVVGLETAVPVTITELVRTGVLTPLQMVEKMSYNPAKILGIDRGVLAPGKVADITVVNPTEEYDIDSNRFASKGKNTPFEGKHVYGKVLYTLVNGRVVYSDHNGTEILIEREVPKL